MPNTHPARTGMTFSLTAGHKLYIGPDERGRGPVLAITAPRARKAKVIAEFRNSTVAEEMIAALTAHYDALAASIATAGPQAAADEDPET